MKVIKIGAEELRITVEVLNFYASHNHFGFSESEVEAIKEASSIMASEYEHELDQEAHSEVTIEMEEGREISLTEWARRNGIDPSTARHKALKGGFKTARKVGRDWMINENEKKTDNRRRKNYGQK